MAEVKFVITINERKEYICINKLMVLDIVKKFLERNDKTLVIIKNV